MGQSFLHRRCIVVEFRGESMKLNPTLEAYFDHFAKVQRGAIDDKWRRGLLESLDDVYRAALDADGSQLLSETYIYHDLMLLGRRSLHSAALISGAGQPEDGYPITRRLLEAAKMYLATKLDPRNLERWGKFTERDARWRDRQRGVRPKAPIRINYKKVRDHELCDKIDTIVAMLSDMAVHFTPEFYGSLDWEIIHPPEGGTQRILYVHRDRQWIDRSFLVLASSHQLVYQVLDVCFEGNFLAETSVQEAIIYAQTTSKEAVRSYTREYSPVHLPDFVKSV